MVAGQISKRRESGDSGSLDVEGKKEGKVSDTDFEVSPSSEMKIKIKSGYWCQPIKNFEEKLEGAIPQPAGGKFLNEKITNTIYGNGNLLLASASGDFYQPGTTPPKESPTTNLLMKPSTDNDRNQSHMSSFVGALSRIDMFTNSSCSSSNFCTDKISSPRKNESPLHKPKPNPNQEDLENFNSIDSFLIHERNNLSDNDSVSRSEFYGYPKIMVENSELIIDEDSESERKEAPCEPIGMGLGGGGVEEKVGFMGRFERMVSDRLEGSEGLGGGFLKRELENILGR